VALWLVLKRWWFEPALRVLKERTARSEGAIRDAQAVQAEAERLRREHTAALEAAKGEAQREVHEMIRAAEAEHKRVVSEASAEANRTLAEVRVQIAEQVAAARREIRGQVQVIALEVARKVLGRAV